MALQEELEKQGNWLFRYRGILPLLILFTGMSVYLKAKYYHTFLFNDGGTYEINYQWICLFVSLFGFLIRVYTVGYSRANTSGRNTKSQIADSLSTTGVYSLVRHPLYLGNFFMWLGPALLIENLWFIFVFGFLYWIYYERIMFAEEQFLRKKFAEEYIQWAENVPAFLPSLNFKKYISPSVDFSWKKVLKKEKNGFFAIFLTFSIFNVIGNLIVNEKNFNYPLLILCLLTGVSYLILKYLKRNTNLLEEKGR
ncbi:MAG: methyltransferase family protein [Dysgonomonas sp.]